MLIVRNIALARGADRLLDGVSFELGERERVCLSGRNGCGKSTLLGIVAGRVQADDGEVVVTPGVRIAELPQDVPSSLSGTVRELIAAGAAEAATGAEWDVDRRVERVASHLDLDPDAAFSTLSGGSRRRTGLARALAAEPDLLLLDEPTNHLDLSAIEWLQGLMRAWRGSIVFTTHDRRLIAAAATRILELDRGELTSWPGDYQNFLRRREERAHAERERHARADRRLAEEERWIRQGIKARRTRNCARRAPNGANAWAKPACSSREAAPPGGASWRLATSASATVINQSSAGWT